MSLERASTAAVDTLLFDAELPLFDDEEIDEATKIHGYGTLSTGQRISAFGPRVG